MGRLADLAAAGHPAQGGPHEHGSQPGAAGAVPGPAGAGRGAGPAPAVPLHRAARKNRPARRRGRRLPPQLADAPKRGFPVPLADWLRQEKYYALVKAKLTGPAAERFFDTGALCALLDAHRAGKTNAMTKLWAFYCFIEWYEVYFTGKIPPDL